MGNRATFAGVVAGLALTVAACEAGEPHDPVEVAAPAGAAAPATVVQALPAAPWCITLQRRLALLRQGESARGRSAGPCDA
jgi:hypothetical protein